MPPPSFLYIPYIYKGLFLNSGTNRACTAEYLNTPLEFCKSGHISAPQEAMR